MAKSCISIRLVLADSSLRLRNNKGQTAYETVLTNGFDGAWSIDIDTINQEHIIITLDPIQIGHLKQRNEDLWRKDEWKKMGKNEGKLRESRKFLNKKSINKQQKGKRDE